MNYRDLLDQIKTELGKLPYRYHEGVTARARLYSEASDPDIGKGRIWVKNHTGKMVPDGFDQVLSHEINSLKFLWTVLEENDGNIWLIESAFSIAGYQNLAWTTLFGNEGRKGKFKKDEDLNRLGRLAKHEKFLYFGSIAPKFYLLIRLEDDSHALYLWTGGEHPPHKLRVKLKEFIDLMISVRGINEGIIYLCEEFPEELRAYPYDGFFEKVEQLFPGTDLSAFHFREQFSFEESAVRKLGELAYRRRTLAAYEKMPDGTTFRRWHPDAEVMVTADTWANVISRQISAGLQFSFPMTAFWLANLTLQVDWSVDGSTKGRYEFFRIEDLLQRKHAPDYYKVSPGDAPDLVGKWVFYTDTYNDMLVQFEGDGVCSFHLLHLEADDYKTHFITDDFDWLVERLFQTRGMYWWNYYLVFKPSAGDARYETFYQQMKEYFPDTQLAPYPELGEL